MFFLNRWLTALTINLWVKSVTNTFQECFESRQQLNPASSPLADVHLLHTTLTCTVFNHMKVSVFRLFPDVSSITCFCVRNITANTTTGILVASLWSFWRAGMGNFLLEDSYITSISRWSWTYFTRLAKDTTLSSTARLNCKRKNSKEILKHVEISTCFLSNFHGPQGASIWDILFIASYQTFLSIWRTIFAIIDWLHLYRDFSRYDISPS